MSSDASEQRPNPKAYQARESFDLSAGRPDRAKANRMTHPTIEYGRKWQEELRAMALERTHEGAFAREFAFSHDWQALLDEIAADIIAKATEKKGPGPLIVLIGGGGAAGKSTLYLQLERRLRPALKQRLDDAKKESDPVKKLELDEYFYPIELIQDREADGKYDNPLNSDLLRAKKNLESLKRGEDVVIPVHDRDKHKLANQTCRPAPELKNARVVVVEGLYTLGPCLRDLGDVAVYIDASPLDRAKGRVCRDINVRKRDEEHVVTMLVGREAYHQTFVEPTQTVADYIVRRGHTAGSLSLLDEEALKNCFEKACTQVGLDQNTTGRLWKEFTEEQRKKRDEEAAKTEF